MSLSRRQFVQTLSAGAAGAWIGSRGREASIFGGLEGLHAQGDPLILASNENPLGPSQAVLNAVRGSFSEAGRYPFATAADVTRAIAESHKLKPENVLIGSGSTQILRTSTHVFTSKTRPLVACIPAYEECADYARLMGHPISTVALRPGSLTMDLDALLGASKGGGLVFYCNPNNPVATGVDAKGTRDFIAALLKASPDTTILVDEAYFEYATMPGYETMIPLAVDNPRVVVARTFSKAYGMAGLRIGYAVGHRDAIKKMGDWDGNGTVSVLALAAGMVAATQDPAVIREESRRNTEARAFTAKWFSDRGYTPTDSQTNFLFVDIKRPCREFREACAKQGVMVGRDFPPYEKTHCRISISTLADMQRAVQIFEKVLAQPSAAAAAA
jgi:histidinol-phosphate aminotransferase